METDKEFRAGYVALVGRPNVGKSTLLNTLVGEKISIVTSKPHTTRNRILGVLTRDDGQAVFIDTPGYSPRSDRVLHRLMARSLNQTRADADLVVLVTEAHRSLQVDESLMRDIAASSCPAILVINKIDRLKSRDALLPRLEELRKYPFVDYVPISALKSDNTEALAKTIIRSLPRGPALFPSDFKTDLGDAFRAAEVIREKLMTELHQEIPYGIAVQIESLRDGDEGRLDLNAVIWIERSSQKAIVIGKEGSVLKRVGRAARLELNELLGRRIHLELWVKLREHWSDNIEELKRLGFDAS